MDGTKGCKRLLEGMMKSFWSITFGSFAYLLLITFARMTCHPDIAEQLTLIRMLSFCSNQRQ
jgi:hypothetical protein